VTFSGSIGPARYANEVDQRHGDFSLSRANGESKISLDYASSPNCSRFVVTKTQGLSLIKASQLSVDFHSDQNGIACFLVRIVTRHSDPARINEFQCRPQLI
jgi:hypothetical protein